MCNIFLSLSCKLWKCFRIKERKYVIESWRWARILKKSITELSREVYGLKTVGARVVSTTLNKHDSTNAIILGWSPVRGYYRLCLVSPLRRNQLVSTALKFFFYFFFFFFKGYSLVISIHHVSREYTFCKTFLHHPLLLQVPSASPAAAARATPAPAPSPRPSPAPAPRAPASRHDKQLAFLLMRQKQFKEAALKAKKNGEYTQ